MRSQIDLNLIKIGVHTYLSNGYLNILYNFNSKKVSKSAYLQPWFNKPLTSAKIAPNLTELGVHAYLSNGYPNPLSKLNYEKVKKMHIFNPGLTNLE